MRELASLLNNRFPHSNVDHNDMLPIAATRWQVLKEVRFDLTRAGDEMLLATVGPWLEAEMQKRLRRHTCSFPLLFAMRGLAHAHFERL